MVPARVISSCCLVTDRTDYSDYETANGSYVESFKPCDFKTNAQIRLEMLSAQNIAGTAFSGQVIFMIEVPC